MRTCLNPAVRTKKMLRELQSNNLLLMECLQLKLSAHLHPKWLLGFLLDLCQTMVVLLAPLKALLRVSFRGLLLILMHTQMLATVMSVNRQPMVLPNLILLLRHPIRIIISITHHQIPTSLLFRMACRILNPVKGAPRG